MKEYEAKMDTKKRVTLRGATYEHYHVEEYSDGKIVLEPMVLVKPFEVSKKSLAAMDASVKSLKKGKASKPVDLSAFAEE